MIIWKVRHISKMAKDTQRDINKKSAAGSYEN